MFNTVIRRCFSAIVVATLAFTGYALAQQPLPPFLTGRNTENARMIFDAGMFAVSRNSALTANPGGGQANGVFLGWGMNEFTTVATAGDSATLPNYNNGLIIFVVNASANSMNIFPQAGGTINALGANAAYALAAGKAVILFQASNGKWYANLSA